MRDHPRSCTSILGYLSTDDLLKPRAVSRAVETLRLRREAVSTYSDYDLISPGTVILRTIRTPDFDYAVLVRSFVGSQGRVPSSGARHSCGVTLRMTPDFEFLLRLGREGDLVRGPETLATFREPLDGGVASGRDRIRLCSRYRGRPVPNAFS